MNKFSSFLIQDGHLDEKTFLDCFIEFLEASPCIIRIIREKGILSDKELVEKINQCEDGNLIQAIGIENNQLLELVNENNSVYFTDFLIKKEIFSKQEIIELVKKFENLENNEDSQVEVKKSDDVAINQAAIDSLKALGMSDEQIMKELKVDSLESQEPKESLGPELENENIENSDSTSNPENVIPLHDGKESFFKKKNHENIIKIIKLLIENEEPKNYINSLYREVLQMKGAFCLADNSELDKPLNELIGKIEYLLTLENEDLKKWLNQSSDDLLTIIDYFWKSSKGLDDLPYTPEEVFSKVEGF